MEYDRMSSVEIENACVTLAVTFWILQAVIRWGGPEGNTTKPHHLQAQITPSHVARSRVLSGYLACAQFVRLSSKQNKACILAHPRDVWNRMLVDLPAEWQVGSKLQLAAENTGSSMWCTNLNSLRETADALQDALVFPSFHLFRGHSLCI